MVEQFNTIYDCAFLGSDDENSGGGGSMLCTAHHSGDVRCVHRTGIGTPSPAAPALVTCCCTSASSNICAHNVCH